MLIWRRIKEKDAVSRLFFVGIKVEDDKQALAVTPRKLMQPERLAAKINIAGNAYLMGKVEMGIQLISSKF